MDASNVPACENVEGRRVAFLGRLAGMSRRDAMRRLREKGAVVVDRPDGEIDWLILGEQDLSWTDSPDWSEFLDRRALESLEEGRLEILTETELWRRLGLIDEGHHVQKLYTPAMLAELIGVPVSVVRRWHRRGLITPIREVHKLPYFDYREVVTARRLAELLAAGMSPAMIEKKLSGLAKFVPDLARSLAQLSIIVEGKEILLRSGEGLIDAKGQKHFDFEAAERLARQETSEDEVPAVLSLTGILAEAGGLEQEKPSVEELVDMALDLEDHGRLAEAADMYRAALAAGGPNSELCFRLAELLYRLGDLHGARERYLAALEIDEDFVEARANLGCVLAELGDLELAAAAFRGALAFYPDYADAHYLLAKTLTELGREEEAVVHWQQFLTLAPESPWAAQAKAELGLEH
ncbi:MAG: tetratricopeptide repeat protein [Planctomycetota bacterium]|nr:MAG: tetratricopeptide repeat protein [Planctomycetota bacterium]